MASMVDSRPLVCHARRHKSLNARTRPRHLQPLFDKRFIARVRYLPPPGPSYWCSSTIRKVPAGIDTLAFVHAGGEGTIEVLRIAANAEDRLGFALEGGPTTELTSSRPPKLAL